MLGAQLHDPLGVDGQAGSSTGLGLLPLATHYGATKRVLPVQVRFGGLQAPWQALAGIEAPAYEIRTGITQPLPGAAVAAVLHDGQGQAIGWQRGAVLGLYAHGLFESAATMRALFGTEVATLDSSLDGLAALVDRHFDAGVLQRWLGG